MIFWEAVDAGFPRRRDKALFLMLGLAGSAGLQLAFALTHRNKVFA